MEPKDDMRSKDGRNQDRLDQDRLDQWLDAALQESGNAEPRMGLDGRILANLAAEKAGMTAWRRRWWAFGVVAAMAVVVVVLWSGSGSSYRKSARKLANNTPSAAQKTSRGNAPPEIERSVEATVQPRTRQHPAKTVEAAKAQRLSQFPSPRPLSEQEQLLARYVRESPGEAVMVAQAQAERQKELEKLAADESSKVDLDQLER